jgi:glycerol-3-phosphate acyltransferase PlsY
MMIVARIIALLIGYGFGLFQTGYLYGKSKGIDIRQQGSGNAGTTNSLRVLGWKAGIITFAGDLLKAVFAVLHFHWYEEALPAQCPSCQLRSLLPLPYHLSPFFVPNLFSVPFIRRTIFARCLQIAMPVKHALSM